MIGVADERQGRGFHVGRSKRIEMSPGKLGALKASSGVIGRGWREVGPSASPSMGDAPSFQCSGVGGPCQQICSIWKTVGN